jgi:hypothetical protein
MKKSRCKVHFLDVSEPDLKEGSELTANCGAVIKNAAFAMKFDFDLGDVVNWSRTLICQQCLEIEPEQRFIYGIMEWQEALQEDLDS